MNINMNYFVITVFKFVPNNIDEKCVINGSPTLFDH